MHEKLNEYKNKILDLLFPAFCCSCKKYGNWWCEDCRTEVQKLKGEVCPACLSVGGHQCQGQLPFKQVVAFGYYHDPKLRSVITALKFYGASVVAQEIEKFLQNKQLPPGDWTDAVLVPMPLSSSRIRDRGFNQANTIAELIQRTVLPELQISENILTRTGKTGPQSSVEHDLAKRAANVNGVFQAVSAPEKVILVDDVITTGATATEAAKALMSAGAKEVSVIALAIGA